MADTTPSPVFQTTHWSNVLSARGVDTPAARNALEQLCSTYWYPLYAHARRRGCRPEDAADATQDFFASLFRRDSLANVGPEKGRFRTFLLTALDYHLRDSASRAHARKRAGNTVFVDIDLPGAEERLALESPADETPDRAFDRRWARALVERALARLESEKDAEGKSEIFRRLKPLLVREVEPGEYEVLSKELGQSANTLAKWVQRSRRRARDLMLEEAANTLASPRDAEQELRDLFA